MKVEFHCHSRFSGDSLARPKDILEKAQKLGLAKVAITDHDTIRGGLEFAAIAPEMSIIGEEIQVYKDGKPLGELLGYFVKEEIPGGLEVEEALTRLKEQAAFVSVAHPFDRRRSHWTAELLLELRDDIDGIEVFNSRSMTRNSNLQAELFAEQYGFLSLNGSDAHSCYELGRSSIEIPEFSNAVELRSSLKKGCFNESNFGDVGSFAVAVGGAASEGKHQESLTIFKDLLN